MRRDLHRNPELSLEERKTAQRLFEELVSLGAATVDFVAGTGIIARIRGRNPLSPPVAVRGDIDALPIQEATGLEFASVVPGVMHACGHDVHAAWTIGAAHLLSETPAEGDVFIILQPAEEIGKGALAILETGALDPVKAVFGAHVDRRYPVGKVIVQEGPLAASADNFHVTLIGQGAHGARPHEAVDPIVGLGALITSLQTIVSRRIGPSEPAVLTVGTVQAGTAPNIIPERAALSGTLRAVSVEGRKKLLDGVREISEAVAMTFRLKAEVRIETGPPPIVNPSGPIGWAKQATQRILGDAAIVPLQTVNMAGEDFAFYMEKISGCFLRIGACEEGGRPIPSHSPQFYAAEESIFVGAALLAETARVASASIRKEV